MFSFLLLLATVAQLPDFSLDLARRLILYSDAAYCGDRHHGGLSPIQNWTCAPCQSLLDVQFDTYAIMTNVTEQTLAFVGIETDIRDGQERIILSFRGSVLDKNFVDDHDQSLVERKGFVGRVHRGMHRSYVSLQEQLFKHMRNLINQKSNTPVIVTGHSLGAGQAVYGAVDLAANFSSTNFTLISFGTPRPG